MKKLITISLLLFFTISVGFSQPLINEEFVYTGGTFLTDNGYTAHSGGTTNAITVNVGNLVYAGYPAVGLGNHIALINTGQDVNKNLTADVTTGNVYAAMLVNIDSARTGDYFFHLGPNPVSTTFRARVFVKKALNGNLAFGLSKGSTSVTNPPVYTDSIYTTGTTYLLIASYEIVDGASNDAVKLWINPPINSPQPAPLLNLTDATQTDINVGSYAFRQGSSAAAAFLKLDGLMISTDWQTVVPVELTSFAASTAGNSVSLKWATATEINNSGFEVERKSSSSNWQKIAFMEGNGTTTEANSYSFSDKNLSTGKYNYRLKQVDFNGAFEYSNVVEVEVISVDKFELAQNYPNPFNPSTTIKFNLPEAGNVKLAVYNLLGQEVKTLVNGFTESGLHTIKLDATNLNSGIYFYKLEGNGINAVRKMTLLK